MTATVPASAVFDTPYSTQIYLGSASASGTINVGDYLLYSGQYVYAGSSFTVANKASGAGIAIQSNPTYDSHGRVVTATALQFVRQGMFRVSGISGAAAWNLGDPVWPSATGSGVAAPTGNTGVGALWAKAAKAQVSTAKDGGTGAQIVFGTGIATVMGVGASNAGSASVDILLMPARPDYV